MNGFNPLGRIKPWHLILTLILATLGGLSVLGLIIVGIVSLF